MTQRKRQGYTRSSCLIELPGSMYALSTAIRMTWRHCASDRGRTWDLMVRSNNALFASYSAIRVKNIYSKAFLQKSGKYPATKKEIGKVGKQSIPLQTIASKNSYSLNYYETLSKTSTFHGLTSNKVKILGWIWYCDAPRTCSICRGLDWLAVGKCRMHIFLQLKSVQFYALVLKNGILSSWVGILIPMLCNKFGIELMRFVGTLMLSSYTTHIHWKSVTVKSIAEFYVYPFNRKKWK